VDRDALISLAVGHLLRDDLDAAFSSGLDPEDSAGSRSVSLFQTLDELLVGVPDPTITAAIRLDGAAISSPGFERALVSQLNRYNEQRRPGLARARLAPAGDAAVDLALDIQSEAAGVSIAARLASRERVVELARGPSRSLPGRGSLLPPLVAIAIALTLRRTLLALFIGIYAGAVIVGIDRGAGVASALAVGLWNVGAVYLRNELFDTFRIEIIGFIVALVAMIGVMSRAGGVKGLVERLLVRIRTARSALFLTWGMGFLIFFDDYANCMLVGSTMRPLTDRLRISREKLAYIVDSTAAPIAGISLLSTWIAFEVSVFSAQLPEVGITESGYAMFLRALPFRYYCFITLVFVVGTILSRRDFGPMARAELRARRDGLLVRPGGRSAISDRFAAMQPAPQMIPDWRFAAAPIALTLLVTFARIFSDGGGLDILLRDPTSLLSLSGLGKVVLAGSGVEPILAGSCAGLMLAIFLAGSTALRIAIAAGVAGSLGLTALGDPLAAVLIPVVGEPLAGYLAVALVFSLFAGTAGSAASRLRGTSRRPHLALGELFRAGTGSAGALGFAVVLLFEAWMIGAVCHDLATADYLVALLSGRLPPVLLPILLFLVACAVSFATGSSWSTMSILLPNVVALAASMGGETVLGSFGMVAISIGAVLDGSIFGDHCSPISDTTVLSSVASGSDHIDHVRTQAPYALASASLAVGCGYLPSALISWWSFPLALGCGVVLVFGGLAVFGRVLPEARSG
jgi:Na+/H+ antiporter NhaC